MSPVRSAAGGQPIPAFSARLNRSPRQPAASRARLPDLPYKDIIFADTKQEIEMKRKAFIR
jgi:hypothetical protein